MQLGGIRRCEQFASKNSKLICVHDNGKKLPYVDDSIDIVLINETHIAESEIGTEEELIFAEMLRVLKPNGIYLWGNALPTHIWGDAEK